MKLLVGVCALLAALPACCEQFRIDNGYWSLSGSGGVLRDLRVDPAGGGSYGHVLVREAYAGEAPQEGTEVQVTAEENAVTMRNVRICTRPRSVGMAGSDTAVRLEKGATLGQLFTVDSDGMASVSVRVPTWHSAGSGMTLTLRRGAIDGEQVAGRRFERVGDNSWQTLSFPAQKKGVYYIEMSEPRGTVGWWTQLGGTQVGKMYDSGKPSDFGTRSFQATVYDVFPAQVKVSAVGPKLFAQVEPDEPRRVFAWNLVTPFERDGYEISDPAVVPFRRFYSDTGQYLPIAQFKRRDDMFAITSDSWVVASGNGPADLRIGTVDKSLTWHLEADSLTLKIGPNLEITASPASDDVPDYYPVFYSSNPSFDRSLNEFFYERAFSWPRGGINPDWFEWLALIHYWHSRPGQLEYWRETLLTCRIGDDGYVYTWGDNPGWPFPDNEKYDTRHFTTNSNFILACYRFYSWTRDREFLEKNADRLRTAARFLLEDLGGSSGIITLPAKDHGGTPDDVHSNYWDDLPFGGQSAYENAYFYGALGAMASLETALGDSAAAARYNDLRQTCRASYNKLFWNDSAGRYIGCIDENGVIRDYGFTYVNTEAAFYGLPDKAQVERIYSWMENERTSSGKTDTYTRYRFAPRANTIDCRDWWYLNGTAEIPSQAFDTHLENGGAILYTSGFDVMARARYLGADNAFRRFMEIIERWREPDRLCGGSPLRYGEVNGWQVGTDIPFPESGLVPAAFLYSFIGISATGQGLSITPNLPSSLSFAGVRNLRYRGRSLDIRVKPTSVRITSTDPDHPVDIEKTISRGGTYIYTGRQR